MPRWVKTMTCCPSFASRKWSYGEVADILFSMTNPLVYLLVINWNGLEHLRECFDSLMGLTYPNVRILLIDNASTDGSTAFVRENYGADPRLEILDLDTNLGWAGGNNAGISHAVAAGADYVFLLNNDTAIQPDAVDVLVAAAQARPNAGALAPKMLMFHSPEILNSVGLECSIIGAAWDRGIGRLDRPRWNDERPVMGACGGAAFFRVEALRKTGLLTTDFEIYLDDLDLCLQMWDCGYEVWTCPQAVVRHKFSATTGTGAWAQRKYFLNTRNRLFLMMRNFPLHALPFALGCYGIGEVRAIGRSVWNRQWWRVRAHVRSWLSFWGYIPQAVRERQRRSGWKQGQFWPLILKNRMFFGGTDFPADGWYPSRVLKTGSYQPISARAWADVPGGRLRLYYVNCYPRLGAVSIQILSGGNALANIETLNEGQCVLEVPPGRIEFVAQHIFEAEQTGEQIDIGGWLRLEVT